ncbi:MAG: nucleotidyltransferase domain-containing protein [Saprospiraceae bacterium]|jgi:predicted nucleotidyltransferase|nr:nucleotidyltransferase domain-containing protein [Candidatus Defluviibacterium haderslevense]MBK7243617.1 nucleotidyltransferase domain-containing protein [Candidatus Defluviibacterium haderslevense]MCC7028130.1 nucleotidyltransferase domain-containing protein [Saprospiraceae bacterium]
MNDKKIISRIKEAIKNEDSNAQVILFGSRARNEEKIDSDWDILVLLSKSIVNIQDEQKIRHKLYDIELDTGETLSTFVYSVDDWNTRLSVTPLYDNIKREGIYL